MSWPSGGLFCGDQAFDKRVECRLNVEDVRELFLEHGVLARLAAIERDALGVEFEHLVALADQQRRVRAEPARMAAGAAI